MLPREDIPYATVIPKGEDMVRRKKERREVVRVVLADDSAIVVEVLGKFLKNAGSYEVVDTANDGPSALASVEAHKPDLLIMDLQMPLMNGLKVLEELKDQPYRPRIILASLHDEPPYRRAALRSGADAFCSKMNLLNDLREAINRLFPATPV
jgi:DNA-binding NarL/FixJ family response regulator